MQEFRTDIAKSHRRQQRGRPPGHLTEYGPSPPFLFFLPPRAGCRLDAGKSLDARTLSRGIYGPFGLVRARSFSAITGFDPSLMIPAAPLRSHCSVDVWGRHQIRPASGVSANIALLRLNGPVRSLLSAINSFAKAAPPRGVFRWIFILSIQ